MSRPCPRCANHRDDMGKLGYSTFCSQCGGSGTVDDDAAFEMRVPGSRFRMTPTQGALWDVLGQMLAAAVAAHGRDMAYSIVLSRITRELRREIGLEGAKAMLRQLVDTMDEAAENDR